MIHGRPYSHIDELRRRDNGSRSRAEGSRRQATQVVVPSASLARVIGMAFVTLSQEPFTITHVTVEGVVNSNDFAEREEKREFKHNKMKPSQITGPSAEIMAFATY